MEKTNLWVQLQYNTGHTQYNGNN